jgi:hypothetical protein
MKITKFHFIITKKNLQKAKKNLTQAEEAFGLSFIINY